MKDREDFSKVIADISILFELSLAVGQSLDLQTNCDRFLKTLMARKNLGYSSVWIKGEYLVDLPEEILLEDRDENSAFLVYANPESRIKEKSIPPHHLIFSMLEGKEAFSIASTEDRFSEIITEKGIDKGIFAIFSLGKLGFLKLFSMMRETPFGKEELNQLNNVVSKFTISLEGCIAHQKVVRDITERKRAEEALKQSEETALRLARETATIAEIGRIISSTLNIEEVYQRFAEEVRKVLLFDRVTINMVDVEENIVTVPYAAGIPVPERQPGDNFPSAGSFTEVAIRTRRAMIFHPENENEVANRFPGLLPVFRAGLRAMMMIPLISRDEAIGVLHFAAIKPNAYTNIDLELAESIGAQIAGAIANAQLFRERERAENTLRKSEEEARRLAQENALVAEVGRIIGSTPNIDEVFERFSKAGAKLIPFDRIVINLRGPQEDDSFVRYVAGIDVPNRRAGEYVPLAGTATAECMRTKSSLLIQPKDVKEIEEWVARFPRFLPNFEAGIRSAILVPLIAEDRVIGVLSLRTTKTQAYTDQDVRLAESIASQIAGAVANAQLYIERTQAEEAARRSEEAAQQLAKENEVIAEIGRIISSTLRIEEVYELFAKEAGKLIPLDRIAITLINHEANKITSLYISGVQVAGRKAGDSYSLGGSISEEIMRTRKSLFIQTEDQDELVSYSPDLLTTFQAGLRSMITVPLISKDQVIGLMHIRAVKPNAYTNRDVQLAERIGAQIAGAIANAQLFAELKRLEGEQKKLIRDLQDALANIKILRGMLPICSSCKKIRDDKGYWNQIESYIRDHTEAEFTHGICPECMKRLYPDFCKEDK